MGYKTLYVLIQLIQPYNITEDKNRENGTSIYLNEIIRAANNHMISPQTFILFKYIQTMWEVDI